MIYKLRFASNCYNSLGIVWIQHTANKNIESENKVNDIFEDENKGDIRSR